MRSAASAMYPEFARLEAACRSMSHMAVRSLSRREFIALFGCAAAWPLAGHAQQPERMRRVGALMTGPENNRATQASKTAFVRALDRLGWVRARISGST